MVLHVSSRPFPWLRNAQWSWSKGSEVIESGYCHEKAAQHLEGPRNLKSLTVAYFMVEVMDVDLYTLLEERRRDSKFENETTRHGFELPDMVLHLVFHSWAAVTFVIAPEI